MSYSEQFGQALVNSMTERMNPMNAAISTLITGQAKDQALAIEDRVTASIMNVRKALAEVRKETTPDTAVIGALETQLSRLNAIATKG